MTKYADKPISDSGVVCGGYWVQQLKKTYPFVGDITGFSVEIKADEIMSVKTNLGDKFALLPVEVGCTFFNRVKDTLAIVPKDTESVLLEFSYDSIVTATIKTAILNTDEVYLKLTEGGLCDSSH